jgi:hypothetical protein
MLLYVAVTLVHRNVKHFAWQEEYFPLVLCELPGHDLYNEWNRVIILSSHVSKSFEKENKFFMYILFIFFATLSSWLFSSYLSFFVVLSPFPHIILYTSFIFVCFHFHI